MAGSGQAYQHHRCFHRKPCNGLPCREEPPLPQEGRRDEVSTPRRGWHLWRFVALIPSGCRLTPIHKVMGDHASRAATPPHRSYSATWSFSYGNMLVPGLIKFRGVSGYPRWAEESPLRQLPAGPAGDNRVFDFWCGAATG